MTRRRRASSALKPLMVALALALPAGPSLADAGYAYIDGYYVVDASNEFTSDLVGDEEIDGDGFGVKAAFSLGRQLFLTGEYQQNQYDVDADLDGDGDDESLDNEFTQIRGGLGLRFGSGDVAFYGLGEYIRAEIEAGEESTDDSGFGLHAGLRGENGRLGVTVQGGYVDLGDSSGAEYQGEIDYRLFDPLGVFINYRVTDLEGDDLDIKLSDLRLGVTFYFGPPPA